LPRGFCTAVGCFPGEALY